MQAQAQPSERKRRDWVIILIILLFGFLCVILAGGWAVRFAPNWKLNTNMGSNLDPNSIFLTNVPVNYIEPLDPAILTQPVWVNVFLTPGASFETRTPASTTVAGVTPIPVTAAPTQTKPPPTITQTAPPPTNTFVYIPPTRTFTPNPSATNVDLQITKTDGVLLYTAGSPVVYTIVITNNGSNSVNGAIVSDPKPSQVTTWSWACTGQTNGASGCTPMLTNTNFTDTINLPGNSSITYTVTANIAVSATGNLVNTASVTVPSGYNDINNTNNSATDTDTQYIPSADLQITKTDTPPSTTYVAGNPITYTIIVSNLTGPDDVVNATVTDTFVADLTSITWTCTPSGVGASCAAGGSGNITDNTVDLPVGTSVTYTINATISGSTTGPLSNTATVAVPSGYTDPIPANNSATDTNSQVSVDLQITKTDGVATVDPSATTTYTVRVTNGGPNNVTGAILHDPAVTALPKTVVACSATPGQCVTPPSIAQLESGTFALPLLNNGQFYEITVSATVNATSGSVVTNTATIAAPVGTTDPTPGNNSASDTNTVNFVADLSITKTNNSTHYVGGATKTYIITVTNAGPSDVTGATISDNLPAQIVSWTWTCTTVTGASGCDPAPANASNFTDTVNIQSGGSITYTVSATVLGTPSGTLDNTASIAPPPGTTDPVPGNNSASDPGPGATFGDELIVSSGTSSGGIGPTQDGTIQNLNTGDSVILTLSAPITVNGSHAGPDIIYYEQAAGIGIAMDWIILEVSDGSNWYTILNWGDGFGNPGTNINLPLPPAPLTNPSTCPTEEDNCDIDASLLANGTGVTIDLDVLSPAPIPNGTVVYYIRITVPPGGTDAGVGLDGIYVVP